MAIERPKSWGELLAMLGVLSAVIAAFTMLADIRDAVITTQKTAALASTRSEQNYEILIKRGEAINSFAASLERIDGSVTNMKKSIDSLTTVVDENLMHIIMVNEHDGLLLQRLPEKYGGRVVGIQFVGQPIVTPTKEK